MLLIIETITWKPHVETAMEIALRRRESGDEVVYCNLRRSLPICEDVTGSHRLLNLPEVRLRRAREILERNGVRFLRPDYDRAHLLSATTKAAELLAQCRTVDDLKQLRHGDYFDLGWGVVSSSISLTRNSGVEVSSHRDMLERYCAAAMLVYDKVCQLIDELRPSELLLFNGRFATTRAAMRAAQSRGIPWMIHERGGNKDRYWLTNYPPHDMDRVQDDILAQSREGMEEAGHAFYQARRNRIERDWHSFTHGQKLGQLPAEMTGDGEWITFFTSSEDEMSAIGDSYSNKLFPTQFDAIRAVAEAVRSLPGLRLCIRVHPHVAEKSRADQQKWAEIGLPNVLVIGPTDATDSYALMERSKVVCTYGSTVGVEATYWHRPSLLFGRAYYDRIGACEIASSPDQIRAFLHEPVVYPRQAALPYGAFRELLGEPYRFYEADDLHRGRICGVYLDDSPPVRVARWLLKPALRRLGLSR